MKRLTLFVAFVALFHVAGYSFAQQKIERKGAASTVKLDEVMSGYLTALNGKYKLVATEATFEPGGSISDHHHAGPGIRYVLSGELTLVGGGKTRTYKTGEYFYESGDVATAASNKGKTPVRIINFEILPADLKGGSAIPPKSK